MMQKVKTRRGRKRKVVVSHEIENQDEFLSAGVLSKYHELLLNIYIDHIDIDQSCYVYVHDVVIGSFS